MKETSKKIQATIRQSFIFNEDIPTDDKLKYIALMEKVISSVDQYHNQPRKVKAEVMKIVEEHANL